MSWTIFVLIVLSLNFAIVLFILYKIIQIAKQFFDYPDYEMSLTHLQNCINICYDMIYRYHILSYKLSGSSLDQETLNDLRQKFLDTVYMILGEYHYKTLLKRFGKESLDAYILFIFEQLLDKDITTTPTR